MVSVIKSTKYLGGKSPNSTQNLPEYFSRGNMFYEAKITLISKPDIVVTSLKMME